MSSRRLEFKCPSSSSLNRWWLLPNYPKKQTGLTYLGLLKSTMTIFCSQPILIQACFIGWASCSIFVSWWTTLTFLLSDAPYHYSEFRISLFAIAGLGAVVAAPIVGRMADRILPNIVTFIGRLQVRGRQGRGLSLGGADRAES